MYIIGRSLIANSTEELPDGTNAVCLTLLTRKSDPDMPPEPAMSVHVDDVAFGSRPRAGQGENLEHRRRG
jgi:hypothetical protein